MLIEEPVTVPRVALARAWEWEQIGAAHPVLGVVEWWMEDGAARTFDDLVRQVLAEPGFYDLRRQRLTGDFRDVLWGISTADAECYRLSGARDGHTSAALAVLTGRAGLLITVDDDRATLVRIPARRLCRAVVDTLPNARPAAIGEIKVPRAEYGAGPVSESYDLDTTSDYTAPDGAEQVRALMAAPRSAMHQFYVASRARRKRSSSYPLTAVDTVDHGRVLTMLQNGSDGHDIISCGPGSRDYITSALDNTMRGLDD
ncbi:ESX secretion-associated protein EspG [Amycolatopsis panacis]|uniref:ESX secretion-associated protein EspG n=1 Tax=Amycolatopsis panacis TaxID=2340917 RepID=A0A419I4P6_9PSEU|nr:ESX secretion-associated protein EspG [Amycolatopsis panacis]RJQ85447.1 ESX secretion-associated protein EspG [Amycolatopsis panacis]